MTDTRTGKHVTERKQLIAGLGLVVVGMVVAVVGAFLVHTSEAETVNEFGQEMFAGFPRGWQYAVTAQVISLGGVLMTMAGVAIAFIYGRTLTWARAMTGALLFAGLMFILFAVIPNQMLTFFQATLEWTPQKIFLTIPGFLVLNNDISISYAALKDMLVAGYVTTLLFVIPVFMYQWQVRMKKRREAGPKPTPVSRYGRPMRAGG
jgi:hypothetical protein